MVPHMVPLSWRQLKNEFGSISLNIQATNKYLSCRIGTLLGLQCGARCGQRPESIERYARRVEINEIEANDCNLNISRYVSTAEQEVEIDLSVTHKELVEIEKQIQESTAKHNAFLKELGLSPLPAPNK